MSLIDNVSKYNWKSKIFLLVTFRSGETSLWPSSQTAWATPAPYHGDSIVLPRFIHGSTMPGIFCVGYLDLGVQHSSGEEQLLGFVSNEERKRKT